MQTKINWFEIPSHDFERAVRFYESIFDTSLKCEPFGPFQMGVFCGQDQNQPAVGCVIQGENYIPGGDGAVMYLDAGQHIDTIISRIEPAGGRIKFGKMALPGDLGVVAYFIDTEGNRLALHGTA